MDLCFRWRAARLCYLMDYIFVEEWRKMMRRDNHDAVRQRVETLAISLRAVSDVVARIDHDIRVDDRATNDGAA